MAAAFTSPPTRTNIRDNILVAGTGWALTHSYTVTVVSQEMGAEVTINGTTDGAGAFSAPGSFRPQQPGIYTVIGNDGTSTVSYNVVVYT